MFLAGLDLQGLAFGSRMVMIWYFDNKSPLSINIFAIYLRWTIVEPG